MIYSKHNRTNSETEVSMTAFLRWAGSKRQLLPTLTTYWSENFNTYHEPFLGSGSLLFSLSPNKAAGNDLNKDLIQMYEAVRDNPKETYREALDLEVTKEVYYATRGVDPRELDPIKRAARFIYLNRNCFNGIYRTNKSGKFNVPFSGKKTGSLPSYEIFKNASKQLRRTRLTSVDFEEAIINDIHENDFFYLDPPYISRDKRIFSEYGPECFTEDDMKRLIDCTDEINKRGAFFLLSFAECDRTMNNLSRFITKKVETRRVIASSSKKRRIENELLITNIDFDIKKTAGSDL